MKVCIFPLPNGFCIVVNDPLTASGQHRIIFRMVYKKFGLYVNTPNELHLRRPQHMQGGLLTTRHVNKHAKPSPVYFNGEYSNFKNI